MKTDLIGSGSGSQSVVIQTLPVGSSSQPVIMQSVVVETGLQSVVTKMDENENDLAITSAEFSTTGTSLNTGECHVTAGDGVSCASTTTEAAPLSIPNPDKSATRSSSTSDIADVLTESMVKEEEQLVEATLRETETDRQQNAIRMKSIEQEDCYNRLKFLLNKSQIYTSYLSKRMEDQRVAKLADNARRQARDDRKQELQQVPSSSDTETGTKSAEKENREEVAMESPSAVPSRGGLRSKARVSSIAAAAAQRRSPRGAGRRADELSGTSSPLIISSGSTTSGQEGSDVLLVVDTKKKKGGRAPVSDVTSPTAAAECVPSSKKRGRSRLSEVKSPESVSNTETPLAKRPKLDDDLLVLDDSKESKSKVEDNATESERTTVEACDQPKLLSGGTLRTYQMEGFRWLKMLYENGVNGILADEMGLGKTIQCIALICELLDSQVDGPFLVCAPLSTIPNWVHEMAKFAPLVPYVLYHGSKPDRASLRHSLRVKQRVGTTGLVTAPVVITSYEIAMQDRQYIATYPWKLLIVDEGQRIKNNNCRLIRELRLYQSSHRLLLSGTPLQNNMAELWSLLNFLIPEIFDNLSSFETWFDVEFLETVNNAHEQIVVEEQKKHTLSMLHQILAPFMLRRLKTDVDFVIPPKREVLVYTALTPVQMEIYRSAVDKTITSLLDRQHPAVAPEPTEVDGNGRPIRKSRNSLVNLQLMFEDESSSSPCEASPVIDGGKEEAEEEDDDEISRWAQSLIDGRRKRTEEQQAKNKKDTKPAGSVVHITLRNVLAMLRRCCNHPYLIEYPLMPDGQFRVDEELVSSSCKLALLDRMLVKLHAGGHKVLIFSQMTSMLDVLEDYCHLRHHKYSRLDGSMKVTDRQVQIERYDAKDVFIFLLSTRAGGLGINLVQADTVIIYDSDWNPQCDLQAQDRCHRIGQTRPVVVYRLVASNTVDQKIVERAGAKRKLEKMVIHKGKFKSRRDSFQSEMMPLNATELLSLLKESDYEAELGPKNSGVMHDTDLDLLLDRTDLYRKWTAQRDGKKSEDPVHEEKSNMERTGVFTVVNEVWEDTVLPIKSVDGAQ